MTQNNSWKSLVYGVFSFVFVALPFIFSRQTMDPEGSYRQLALATFLVFASLFLSLKKNFNFQMQKSIAILILLSLVWTLFRLSVSINSGDAWIEWLRLFNLLFFLVLSSNILSNNWEQVLRILPKFAVVSGCLIVALSIPEWYTQFTTERSPIYYHTVSATFGSKNFLSEVLVLLSPIIVCSALIERNAWKWFSVFTFILILISILLLKSAAAILALFICILSGIILLYSFKMLPTIFYKRSFILISTGVILLLFITIVFFTPLRQRLYSLKQYGATEMEQTSLSNNNSVFERLLLWRNTARMIKHHPITGVGLNNWKIVYPSYGLVQGTEFINSGQILYEHPHNDYLLILAEQGWIGVLIYIGLFIIIIRMGYDLVRKLLDHHAQFLVIAILCAIISFCVLSCFAFPRSKMVPMILLMLFFATISSLNICYAAVIRLPRFLILCFACISAFSVYAVGVHLNGEVHLAKGLVAQSSHDLQRMSREMKKAENYFFSLDGTNTPIEWYNGMSAFYLGDPIVAKEYFLRAEKVNPYHMRLLNDLGTCYEQTGDGVRALVFYKRALNITPEFVEGLLNTSATYYNLKQFDSAYTYIERAARLNKNYIDSKNYQVYLKAILLARMQSIKNSVSDTSCFNRLAVNPDSTVMLFQQATMEHVDFLLMVRQKCR